MATSEILTFNEAHAPHENSVEAFHKILGEMKFEILKSRRHWDQHEPKMWSKASGLSDDELTGFTLENDLVLVRSAPTSYGQIILGKLRIPALEDGYVHIRIHDPPGGGPEDVKFHSIFTEEGHKNEAGNPTTWNAIHTLDKPLEFFNE
ncbi:hypothetical protein BDZ89DRAFT_1005741 [Hymenopellis radicata]|nr:hypothetical protein BDZ89DRAFT_1005741 [Hymenopellis radicata]